MSKVVAWLKEVYTDGNISPNEINVVGLPTGKYIVRGRQGLAEIEINAPNVDEKDFAPWNVCPVDTVKVGLACLTDTEEIEPLPDYSCPTGYILGEKTKSINIIGMQKPTTARGIVADEVDMNPEIMEARKSQPQLRVEVESEKVCVAVEPMPPEPKIVRLVTDSIIGWGGYQEFPFWDIPWDGMDYLATKRYHGAKLLDKKGFVVCGREYKEDFCLAFSDKKDAEYFKEGLEYYNSDKVYEDIKERLKEEGREPTEEEIIEQAEFEKQQFWNNIEDEFPSYLGSMSIYNNCGSKIKSDGGYIFLVGRNNGKWHENIVCADEKDVMEVW